MTTQGLVVQGQLALGLSYRGLAELVGSSLRTCQRWGAGRSTPASHHLATLARHVHASDPKLAAQIAAGAGTSLEALGLGAPTTPPPVASPPAQLVENIVYAAAEAMDVSPRVIMPAVRAAFARARELGVDAAAVDSVLSPRVRSSAGRVSKASSTPGAK
jgi:hypothetical protein